jgi:hypothetical protein
MTSDLRFKRTSRLLLPAAAAVLVAVGIAQNRVVALGAHEPRPVQISDSGQPEHATQLRNPHRYGTPTRSTNGFRFGRVENFFAPAAAQLLDPDPIVCEGNVTEGGWGHDSSGSQVTFGGSASVTANNARGGHEEYSNHDEVDGFTFHSFVISDVDCEASPLLVDVGHAHIEGQGRVTNLAASEDLQVNFEIELFDIAEPGAGMDQYKIRLTGGFSYDSGLITLEGGNVQIRSAQ